MNKKQLTLTLALILMIFSCTNWSCSKSDDPVENKEKEEENTGPPPTSFTDARDGKTYRLVTIGDQTWFAENLAFDSEGSSIYGSDSNNLKIYGRLYTTAQAEAACPDGFHVPSDKEWAILIDSTGGDLKEPGTAHWVSPNIAARDSFKFSVIGSGFGTTKGAYQKLNVVAHLWTTHQPTLQQNTSMVFSFDRGTATRSSNYISERLSVRCIMD